MIDPQLKKRIVNTISEYEKKCGGLQEDLDFLKSSMMRLCSIPQGINDELDAHLLRLQQAIDNHKEIHSLPDHIEALTGVLSNMHQLKSKSKRRVKPEPVSSSVDIYINAQINECLLQLLNHLAIPDELNNKTVEVRHDLEQQLTNESLTHTVGRITDLVIESFNIEQNRFKCFLAEITEQLSGFENYLNANASFSQAAKTNSELLETGIQGTIEEMRAHIDNSKSLEELSQKVGQNLEVIGNKLKSFKDNEQTRTKQHEIELAKLQEQLSQSEQHVAEMKSIISSQNHRVTHDGLTELPNRAAYDRQIVEAFQRHERGFGELSLAIADIDHFKMINDSFGHLAGDKVLKKVASIFRESVRTIDFIARYGGEEFAMIFERTSEDDAYMLLEKLREAVQNCQFSYRDQTVDVTVSFGLATIHANDDPESLFSRADELLYKVKHLGRNRVER